MCCAMYHWPDPVPAFIPDGGPPATGGMVGDSGTGRRRSVDPTAAQQDLVGGREGSEEPEATLSYASSAAGAIVHGRTGVASSAEWTRPASM